MSESAYRLHQPQRESLLCKVGYDSEVIRCPANAGHARGGQRTSPLRLLHLKKGTRRFAYSWASSMLISVDAVELLRQANISGFSVEAIDAGSIKNREASQQFNELVVDWHGEFVANPDHCRVKSYCPECGLIVFGVYGDPPWAQSDIASSLDFWTVAPCFEVFCSSRAYEVLKEFCGDEFVAAPALKPLSHEVPRRTMSLTWPPVWPPYKGMDLRATLEAIRSLDVDNVLPVRMYGS